MNEKNDENTNNKGFNKKISIIVGIVLAIIIISCSIVFFIKKVQENKVGEYQGTGLIDLNNKENVKIEDNQKINISEELKKEKQVKGIVVKDIQLKTQSNMTNLVATVQNVSSEVFEAKEVSIVFKNQDDSEFAIVKGYIDTMEPGGTATLNTYTMADVANAYDFEIQFN